jgi:hypothetical protein
MTWESSRDLEVRRLDVGDGVSVAVHRCGFGWRALVGVRLECTTLEDAQAQAERLALLVQEAAK